MEQIPPGPVRYRELAGQINREHFYRDFTKIVSDIYVHNSVSNDPRAITEALLKKCPHGVLRGFAALAHSGFELLQEQWLPVISIPSGSSHIRTEAGLILRRVEPKARISMRSGARTVTEAQSVVDVLGMPQSWDRTRDGTLLEEHVAELDNILRQRPELYKEFRSIPALAALMKWTNPLAESRPESILRIRLHAAGMSSFCPQIPVRGRDGSYFIDLGDPVVRVGIDYQGSQHFDRDARARDAQRMNDLRWAGWTILEVTSTILGSQREWLLFRRKVERELREARARRMRRLSS